MRAPPIPAAAIIAMTARVITTGHALLWPVLLDGVAAAGVAGTIAEPDEGRIVGAGEARTAGVGGNVGGGAGVGATVGVGGASEAVMAVTPACAVLAAAVFVGPMMGDCATMAGMTLAPVARRTATVPIMRTMIRTKTFIVRLRNMARSP